MNARNDLLWDTLELRRNATAASAVSILDALAEREARKAGQRDGGTDLALDCAQSLPIGVPKYIVSTVAGSPLSAA